MAKKSYFFVDHHIFSVSIENTVASKNLWFSLRCTSRNISCLGVFCGGFTSGRHVETFQLRFVQSKGEEYVRYSSVFGTGSGV